MIVHFWISAVTAITPMPGSPQQQQPQLSQGWTRYDPSVAEVANLLSYIRLELKLIQTQMAQKPMLRTEVCAHAMRASQNREEEV